jgi:hypothetical protein
MKRKKISTTPPKKDKETPAKEENSFLVGLMKKHDISYDQALKMAIQMDAEKDIFNVSKINLLLQLKGLDDLIFLIWFQEEVVATLVELLSLMRRRNTTKGWRSLRKKN